MAPAAPERRGMQRVPIVDLEPLREGPAGLARVAAEIGAAAREIGFFAVTNHGVPPPAVAALFTAARDFFALPDAVKNAITIDASPNYVGYARLEAEKLDPTLHGDVKESFNMGRERAPDDPDLLAGTPFVGRNQWPQLPGFRATLLDYFERLSAVAVNVHRAIAVDLGLAPDYFAARYDRALSAMRLLHYPPHPGNFDGTQYGAAPHTDYGGLTLLAQDASGGLEVRRRDGEWIAVEPIAGTFVCNIGDAMQRWTNDIYASNAHRVVNRSGRERYSAAFFYEPNPDAEIACIPSCATPGHAAKYLPIAFTEFLRARVEPTYVKT